MGAADAPHTLVLLGHIDTVPGAIPVRIEASAGGEILYGRGSVDAKGPLATFAAAGARLGSAWAHDHNVRLVVVGAVEEEAATSKGARFIRDRFNGHQDPIPTHCIIGEPSGWSRITLGYKGRLLIELEAAQPMAHTAGPDQGVATVAVAFWNWIAAYTERVNFGHERLFDQWMPSLRELATWTDEAMQDRVRAKVGIRLPLELDAAGFVADLAAWAAACTNSDTLPDAPVPVPGSATEFSVSGPALTLTMRLIGFEPAWRSERSTPLVRAFLAGIRTVGDERPGYLVKTGTSDMNVVGPAWNCPMLAYGPGDSSLDHTPHEHIALDDYWRAVLVLEETLRHLAVNLA